MSIHGSVRRVAGMCLGGYPLLVLVSAAALLASSGVALAQWLPLQGVTQAAAGGHTTCAVLEGGALKCWGNNFYGQLGDGSTTRSPAPIAVWGMSPGVRQVASGGDHVCAVLDDGGIRCWGKNQTGQLGDGTTTDRSRRVSVSGLTAAAAAVDAGDGFSCALLVSGDVQCWGANALGQLGDGSGAGSLVPVAVAGLPGPVAHLAVGESHVCVLLQGGAVWCWGYNTRGAVGDGTTTNRFAPVAVALEQPAISLAAGDHTCAVQEDGSVWCWGGRYDPFGLTGVRTIPQIYSGSSQGRKAVVAAGGANLCVLTVSGEVWCGSEGWPDRIVGGIGYAVGGGGAGEVAELAVGSDHVCARLSNSEMKCWAMPAARGLALNEYGELGDGTTRDRYAATTVGGFDADIVTVAAGGEHTCALQNDGVVRCLGDNSSRQLGDGTDTDRYAPVSVSGLERNVAALVAGSAHSCALLDGGSVRCWGGNGSGQLGDGSTTGSASPVVVSGLDGAVLRIVAGSNHTCVATQAGTVQCWGSNGYGQLGDGTTQRRVAPVTVTGLGGEASMLAATLSSTCALMANGEVKCWGANNYGQIGDGTFASRTVPVSVVGLGEPAAAISARHGHVCAVLAGGGVKCWGENRWGQLGDGGNGLDANRPRPVSVEGLDSAAIAVAAGNEFTCVMLAVGAVRCWGRGIYGHIGDGDYSSNVRLRPVTVEGLEGTVTMIAAGGSLLGGHACAVLADGRLRCWGANDKGQVGHRNYYWPSYVLTEHSWMLFLDGFEFE